MGILFNGPMYERQGMGTLAHALYGGADFGECLVTAKRIKEGDAASWYREWQATADRIYGLAEASVAKGHRVSAREAYLRASNYYRASYLFLFGAPVDARLVAAFDREVEAFLKATALFRPAIEPVEIPFEDTTPPGYFYRADDSSKPRPTLIATNGYDSTIQQMHFGYAVAAMRRGYNCLLFDGPGQGRVLIKQHLHMRPDWENVVRSVVDYAFGRPEVDPKRLALIGWSFGGRLPGASGGFRRTPSGRLDRRPRPVGHARVYEGPHRRARWRSTSSSPQTISCPRSPTGSAVRRYSPGPRTIPWRATPKRSTTPCAAPRSLCASTRPRVRATTARRRLEPSSTSAPSTGSTRC